MLALLGHGSTIGVGIACAALGEPTCNCKADFLCLDVDGLHNELASCGPMKDNTARHRVHNQGLVTTN